MRGFFEKGAVVDEQDGGVFNSPDIQICACVVKDIVAETTAIQNKHIVDGRRGNEHEAVPDDNSGDVFVYNSPSRRATTAQKLSTSTQELSTDLKGGCPRNTQSISSFLEATSTPSTSVLTKTAAACSPDNLSTKRRQRSCWQR